MSETADQPATISSHRIYRALRDMGIDPYGVIEVHISTEFVTVTRSSGVAAGDVVTDYLVDRQGLG
ncbi:hypothetical protein SEA_SPOOKY_99 [Gordonia phage Spooky]|nr:hypothetical protein SEA_SPOOKY_99 [Gordonia phage Spooky]